MNLPRISIITINLNNIKGLEKTFHSVKVQTYSNLEFLIFDGGSSDGSFDFLDKHSSEISYWKSEKDSGIYDAMNKGIEKASGDYLLFLNSGDHFLDQNSISTLVKNSSGEDLVYGDLEIFEAGNSRVKRYPEYLNFRYFYFESLPHPACLISKKLFSKIGLYDNSLKITSDWKFFLLAVVNQKCTYKHVDQPISVFYFDGMSSKPENKARILDERILTLKTYFPWYYGAYSFYLKLLGKNLY